MNSHPRLSFILFFSLLLSGCAGRAAPAASGQIQRLRVPMGYIPNVQYAPFYLAVDRGYFQDAGLEIDFDYSVETDGITLVGAGELQFTLASGEQILLAREQGLPVVTVATWWQDYPVAVAAPKSSGIEEPADLVGKKIGIPVLGGASYIGYRALLSAAGLPSDAATLDVIGFNQVEALLSGVEDAVVVYANNEPIQLEYLGLPVNLIRVADYVHLASNGLVTNERTINDHPELVRGMVAALMRGVADAVADPQAAFEVSKKFVEGLEQADQQVQMDVLRASIEFWKAERLGYSSDEAWQNMHAVLVDMGLISEDLDYARAYTNEFVP
jgi:NitT/TauT family transport system substrate-binding protein